MTTKAFADAVREQIADALRRHRVPAERIDNQLSAGQMAPPQTMPGGGYAPRPHEHDADDISTGTLSPARIPSVLGDVTGPIDDTVVTGLQGAPLNLAAATAGYVITYDGSGWVAGPQTGGGGGGGSVVSVGLALPADVFAVSGSPVTISGTLTGAFATQSANTIFAGPSSGAAAAPAFRALGVADVPALAGDVTGPLDATVVGSIAGVPFTPAGAASNDVLAWNGTSYTPLSIPSTLGAQLAHRALIGPSSGAAAVPTFRALVASDIPPISLATGVSGVLSPSNGGTGVSNPGSTITLSGSLAIAGGGSFYLNGYYVSVPFDGIMAITGTDSAQEERSVAYWATGTDGNMALNGGPKLHFYENASPAWNSLSLGPFVGTNFSAGRNYLTVRGASDAGVLNMQTGAADADGGLIGGIEATDRNSTSADLRAASIRFALDGATGNNRGGAIQFLTKANGASGISERVRISSVGYVGIAVTNPSAPLDILRSGAQQIRLHSTANGGSSLMSYTPDTTGEVLHLAANAYYNGSAWVQYTPATPSWAIAINQNDIVQFARIGPNGTPGISERARIDGAGNVAITGNFYPGANTDVYFARGATNRALIAGNLVATGAIYPSNQASYGLASAAAGVTTNGDFTVGANAYAPSGGTGILSIGSQNVSYTPTSGTWPAQTTLILSGQDFSCIGFHDAALRVDFIRAGGGTMDIGYNGGWGSPTVNIPGRAAVGGTLAASYTGATFVVRGANTSNAEFAILTQNITPTTLMYNRNDGASNGTIVAWTVTSDERAKQDIVPLGEAHRRLADLRPTEYTLAHAPNGGRHYGFVAQDVQAIYPDLVEAGVDVGDDGTPLLGIRYTEMIPLIVQELQALRAELAALRAT